MVNKSDDVTAKIAVELRVARERMDKGIRPSNSAIAAEAGITAMTVGRYLDGERAIPVPAFIAICSALCVDPGALMAKAMQE
ncbi:hypothetical protein ACTXJR_05705 [Glutamicibacter ardleyensis]|uniref:hypothetical protein n=1 Tax=Glutamicibacter ardleyensis TaxID=225894 RepID=UPI003FD4BF10